jgi:murein DD-endopeptidase MepM/ murein hydrolase activator NlpD
MGSPVQLNRRRFLGLVGAAIPSLAATACLGVRAQEPVDVVVDGTVLPPTPSAATAAASQTPTATQTIEPVPYTPTPYVSDLDPAGLTGFTMPHDGACLPSRDAVMPNAPRAYRNGVHEGVDFYHGDVCVPIDRGTPVLAMQDGVVVRADHDYEDITIEEIDALAEKTARQGYSDPETLDIYRGRQVWIDHGHGVLTRYAHLSAIAPSVDVGVDVKAGQLIGAVGDSGTPESITAPGTEYHLHAEVWIGDRFLGQDLPPDEVRRLYERLFSPASPE